MDIIFGLLLGISLSAACGFRIFIPPLIMNLAHQSGQLTLVDEGHWLTSDTALVIFAIATVAEIGAYYIPWLDNALDALATPVAIIAGMLVTESLISDMSPLLSWTIAAILGGGTAGVVQVVTDVTRLASTSATGGLANPVVSTIEWLSSTVLALLAILVPVLSTVVVVGLLVWGCNKLFRRFRHSQPWRSDHKL